MDLLFMPEAENALQEIATWIESKNTPGSGHRFIDKFVDKIASYALPVTTYQICKNNNLASLKLHCIAIDDWIIAFKIEKNQFIVHYILFGAGLK